MNDRELLEFITAQVGNLISKVDSLGKDMNEVKDRLAKVETN